MLIYIYHTLIYNSYIARMSYSLETISGSPITLPSSVVKISTIPSTGEFTVKIGTITSTHKSLEGLIGRINSECLLGINKKTKKIPLDAVLVPLETKEEVVLRKTYVSLAKPEPEEDKSASEPEPEPVKRGRTLQEMMMLLALSISADRIEFEPLKKILHKLLKMGFRIVQSKSPNTEITFVNLEFLEALDKFAVTYKVFKKGSFLEESEPHCILCCGEFIRPRFGVQIIYIAPSTNNIDDSGNGFYKVSKMKPTIEDFVSKKVNEILA